MPFYYKNIPYKVEIVDYGPQWLEVTEMKLENKNQNVAPLGQFFVRLSKYSLFAFLLLVSACPAFLAALYAFELP